MKITKREVVFSSVIICIMLIFGVVLSDKINDTVMEKHQEYNTALQINNDSELFAYGMRTNVGNAFIYGELAAVDPVTHAAIEGQYGSITKITEQYTMHTRTVTKTRTVNGKTETYTDIETYWSWDVIDRNYYHASTISFLGIQFPYGTIEYPFEDYIKTVRLSSDLRDQYYGSDISYSGTLYANLIDNTISNTSFYNEKSIDETLELLETKWQQIVFWIFWSILICLVTLGFYYLDNKWLEG